MQYAENACFGGTNFSSGKVQLTHLTLNGFCDVVFVARDPALSESGAGKRVERHD